MSTPIRLPDRAVIVVTGKDARHFLDRLLTCDIPEPASGKAAFGALLAPQGKILFDFFLVAAPDGYLFDIAAALTPDFLKRLTFYKLRAAVDITDRSGELAVAADWQDVSFADPVAVFIDPRAPAMCRRAIVRRDGAGAEDCGAYDVHRIRQAMPAGGIDFDYGDAFPHDAGFDQFGGVDFSKGCFVGQEVVSRMEHRGSARRRPVAVHAAGTLTPGVPLSAGGPALGTVTSAAGNTGLAIIRLDRAADGIEAGGRAEADGVPVWFERPAWAHYDWPEALSGAAGTGAANVH